MLHIRTQLAGEPGSIHKEAYKANAAETENGYFLKRALDALKADWVDCCLLCLVESYTVTLGILRAAC